MQSERGALRASLLGAVLAAAVAGILAAAAMWPAAAQSYRQFIGRIEAIDAERVVVDPEEGYEVTFRRIPGTEVRGQGKRSWEDLAAGDRVVVSWLLMDAPEKKAYRIQVMPAGREGRDE